MRKHLHNVPRQGKHGDVQGHLDCDRGQRIVRFDGERDHGERDGDEPDGYCVGGAAAGAERKREPGGAGCSRGGAGEVTYLSRQRC